MADRIRIVEADAVEILTLQDNYVDITAGDNSAVVTRAAALRNGEIRNSIIAEHGFSALIGLEKSGRRKSLQFDFGFSEDGAARNARLLGADIGQAEAAVLSHGHSDHFGGFQKLAAMMRKGTDLVLHPAVFKNPRYLKIGDALKAFFPGISREMIGNAGLNLVESREPRLLLDGLVLYLGEIPRRNDFEKGFPPAHFQEGGVEKQDHLEDDTAVAMNLKGKGLVIVSGCAHAGIINTISYAKELTGIDRVHVAMGGFHLSGPLFEPIIGRTTEELKKIDPDYIVPTHCTGRKAVMEIEKAMPRKFILNMSGTKLTFAG